MILDFPFLFRVFFLMIFEWFLHDFGGISLMILGIFFDDFGLVF